MITASAPSAASTRIPAVDPEFAGQLSRLDPTANTDAYVHFSKDLPYETGIAAVRGAGLADVIDLPSINAVYAFGPAEGFEALRVAPEVIFLEDAGTAELHLDTGAWATRARTLYEATGGLDLRVSAPNGEPLDGRGVGVAVVDSGIDGTHPDLKWAGLGGPDIKVIRNFKVVCGMPDQTTDGCAGGVQLTDLVDSDTTTGHGTHVAGIVAGNGLAGDGEHNWQGVAPGAALYGFGISEASHLLTSFGAAAFQWIIDNGANQNPPIKVVTNSWGSAGGNGTNNPASAISQLTNVLVSRGISVVWSIGNSGGDGTTIQTSRYGNNPTPGVISVANYNDQQTGTRNGTLNGSSSRGLATNPETWPDISAPGTSIHSTCKPATAICPALGAGLIYANNKGYIGLTGTSMATPHVAGALALIRQANPNLTPADVENLVEDTAHKYAFGAEYSADPANPDNTSSFDKGHGLLDVRLAVLRALGLPDHFGLVGGPGAPSIDITTPADGATVGRTFQVGGTADSGAAPVSTVIASGDGGDVAPTAGDLTRVSLEERVNGTVAITWEVTDASTAPPTGVEFALVNSINGVARRLGMTWNGTTAACVQELAVNCSASRVGNSLTAVYPATGPNSLGVVRGTLMLGAWAATFTDDPETLHDRAPGDIGATSTTHPARGQEHGFSAPSNPIGAVNLYIDGNPFAANPVATGQGIFSWLTTLGQLSCGSHTVVAEIVLETSPPLIASDSIGILVRRRTSRPTSIPC